MFKIEWKRLNPFNNPKNQVKMKNEKLSAILGRDVNVGEALTAEETSLMEAHLAGQKPNSAAANDQGAPAAEQSANAEPTLAEQIASAVQSSVASALAPISEQLGSINSRLEIVEGKPAATTTDSPAVSGDEKAPQPWENENSPLNKQIAADLGN